MVGLLYVLISIFVRRVTSVDISECRYDAISASEEAYIDRDVRHPFYVYGRWLAHGMLPAPTTCLSGEHGTSASIKRRCREITGVFPLAVQVQVSACMINSWTDEGEKTG